jgi:heptosyltransferase-3
MLVFEGTQDIVEPNPDLRRVLTIPERPTAGLHIRFLVRLCRRYDVALSVLAGDRPTFYAWLAGRYRVGVLLPDRKSWWKRHLLSQWVPFDNLDTHTVAMNLRLLEPLGLQPVSTPVVSWRAQDETETKRVFSGVDGSRPYAVLHVSPKFAYKMWTIDGWVTLGKWLTGRDLDVVVTGGVSPGEQAFVEQVMQGLSSTAVNLAGRLALPALGYLLRRAALYVGTDTAVSHMAAALGVPSVVLFGPSNPVKWGPWPKNFSASSPSPWKTHGSQRQRNVFLVQGTGDCVPCLGEGCDRHEQSVSQCLQQMAPAVVIGAVEEMMVEGERPAVGVHG